MGSKRAGKMLGNRTGKLANSKALPAGMWANSAHNGSTGNIHMERIRCMQAVA
jgi:hypothetical protein